MPSKSARQHRFFEMISHDPGAAKRTGVSKGVARDFVEADKGRKFAGKKRSKGRSKRKSGRK
jgi:hypothetical protein